MRVSSNLMINTPEIELWPGNIVHARSNRDARALARASHVLRRKCDGRFLAADLPEGLQPLVPRLMHEKGIDAAITALRAIPTRRHSGLERVPGLPLHGLEDRLQALGLDEEYGRHSGLALVAEPARLVLAGFDRYRRPLWLHVEAARAWNLMRQAALRDDIALDAISGYRSHAYQFGIFERKRARGDTINQILRVNAAPGYSEHHSGLALDIGAPGEPPAEASFEETAAFTWLTDHAAGYGFVMSYPRDNPHGIIYEPWHWRHG